jgi:DNA-binding XRE family transcriptional regulator
MAIKNEQERQRIGQRIAELRKGLLWQDDAGIYRRGMTQTELAQRTGIGQGHLARIESGRYGVSIDLLAHIAEVLGVSVKLE